MAKTDREDLTAAAFEDAEMANLRSWMKLSGGQKVDFFKEWWSWRITAAHCGRSGWR